MEDGKAQMSGNRKKLVISNPLSPQKKKVNQPHLGAVFKQNGKAETVCNEEPPLQIPAYRFQTLMQIMMILNLINLANPLTVFDCKSPVLTKKYSLIDTVECSGAYPHLINKISSELYYVYQGYKYYYTKVRECRVKKRLRSSIIVNT